VIEIKIIRKGSGCAFRSKSVVFEENKISKVEAARSKGPSSTTFLLNA